MPPAHGDTLHQRRLALLAHYESRAPRYTSYPTAVQFTPAVDAQTYADWLGTLTADEPVSLYAHVPFCARLCWFCGCNTRAMKPGDGISDYVDLLVRELDLVDFCLPVRLRAGALHLGGGTPNMLTPKNLDHLFGALRRVFAFDDDTEIAAELDPSQLTADWALAAAGHGLTRASLGVQDLSPAVQAAVNRRESFDVIAHAAGLLRGVGVRSLNIDLMYGLPRQRTEDVLSTIEKVLTLRPDRIALFGYAHVPWMKAHQKLIHEEDLPGPALRLEQSETASERLVAEGYVRIGLDHFALPHDSLAVALAQSSLRRNFQGYTADQHQTLLGFGASAIGRLPQGLVQNHSAEVEWRYAVADGRLPTARGVAFTDEDLFRGEIIEALMCDFAADLASVRAHHDRPPEAFDEAIARLQPAIRDGVVERKGDRIAVTPMGRPFVRQVAAAFDAHLAPDAVRHSTAV